MMQIDRHEKPSRLTPTRWCGARIGRVGRCQAAGPRTAPGWLRRFPTEQSATYWSLWQSAR